MGDPQRQHGDFAELKRQRLGFSEAEVATMYGQSSKEQEATQRKNYRNMQRGLFESLAE